MAELKYSVMGRPRALGEAQVKRILEWHSNRLTLTQLARDLNVCASTVRHVIRTEGKGYKQAPPEKRAAVLADRRRRRLEESQA